jgi:acyl-CoA synthetase (NDP forming)
VSDEAAEKISKQLTDAVNSGKSVLTLEESRNMMELTGIPLNKSGLAASEEDAVKIAKEIGYPIVMKIVSPQVIHKTEVGGVVVNIGSDDELRKAYNDMLKRIKSKVPKANIEGVLLEEMVKGTELIVGTTIDPQFGHMIMFGIGGIFVEVYKDVSFRLIPITDGDAKDMLNEIKGKAILEGVRGLPKASTEQLVDILLKISNLIDTHPEINEMDINPLIVTERGLVAVDARVILKSSE